MEGNSLINGTKTCFLEWGQVERGIQNSSNF